jgi:hypothetical protein
MLQSGKEGIYRTFEIFSFLHKNKSTTKEAQFVPIGIPTI